MRPKSGTPRTRSTGAWTVGILTSQPGATLEKVGCKLLIEDYHDERFLQVKCVKENICLYNVLLYVLRMRTE